MHNTRHGVSVCSQFRTEAVRTTNGSLNLAHVFASRQHALSSTEGCDLGLTSSVRKTYEKRTSSILGVCLTYQAYVLRMVSVCVSYQLYGRLRCTMIIMSIIWPLRIKQRTPTFVSVFGTYTAYALCLMYICVCEPIRLHTLMSYAVV